MKFATPFLALACLAATILVPSCKGTSVSIGAEGVARCPGLGIDVSGRLSVDIQNNYRTLHLDGLNGYAGKCFEMTWYDANGNEIGTSTGEIAADGSADVSPVPPGAAKARAKTIPCPDASSPVGAGGRNDVRTPGTLVIGFPLLNPEEADDLSYVMLVHAEAEEVDALVDSIVAGGIGTPVSQQVKVVSWVETRVRMQGVILTSGTPGAYNRWSVTANGQAVDPSRVAYRSSGSWSSATVLLRWDELDDGDDLGTVYHNEMILDYDSTHAGVTRASASNDHINP